jgi:lysophospholipase L1-like esterase
MRLASALRGALLRLGVVLGTLFVCALLLEVGLRAFWTGFYLKEEKSYVVPDAARGWKNKPSTTAVYGEAEFRIEVGHNALGYRGREIAREKPPGVRRVLLLGDSFAYGIGVADDETFAARLERLLPGVEVINTGVNGYGTAQELLLLRDEGVALAPDLVVLVFFWNDVGNSYNRAFPRFRLEGERLVWPEPMAVSPAAPSSERRRWLRHSYAYRFVSDRLKLAGFALKVALGLPVETTDFVDPADREAAWRLEAALLREMRDLAARAGARFAILPIPDQVQVEPDASVVGLDPADYDVLGRLQEIASQLGVPVIDLAPALRAEAARGGERLYYPKDRHLNARAHEVVAQALQGALELP